MRIGKWLRLFFGCHAKPERSFFFRGRQFPICARCTGELCGLIVGIPIAIWVVVPNWLVIALMMLPLIVDGVGQLKNCWVSNNRRRWITGLLFGVAVIFILGHIHIYSWNMAKWVAETYIIKNH